MENYTITKEQILELEKTFLTNEKLKEWFPSAFKKELEVGKWYIVDGNKCGQNGKVLIANYSGIEESNNYGFSFSGVWRNDLAIYHKDLGVNTREAKAEEIETALINEAKKRGFVDGAKFRSFEIGNPVRTIKEFGEWTFNSEKNQQHCSTIPSEWERYQSNPAIFKDGKWAQIIPEETKVITIEKAVKILSKKYGKKVEIYN